MQILGIGKNQELLGKGLVYTILRSRFQLANLF